MKTAIAQPIWHTKNKAFAKNISKTLRQNFNIETEIVLDDEQDNKEVSESVKKELKGMLCVTAKQEIENRKLLRVMRIVRIMWEQTQQ